MAMTKKQTDELRKILQEMELAKGQIPSQPGFADTTLDIAIGKLSNMIVSDGFKKRG